MFCCGVTIKNDFGFFSPLDACLFFVFLFAEQFLEKPTLFYNIAPSCSVTLISEKWMFLQSRSRLVFKEGVLCIYFKVFALFFSLWL